jgi:uncharacterized protein YjiK
MLSDRTFHLKIVIVVLLVIISQYGCSNSGNEKKIQHAAVIKLDVPEPSGLVVSADGKFMWTVSDDNNTIYAISFEGKVLRSVKLKGSNLDLEGVAVVDDMTLAVIYERLRTVALVNFDGEIIKSAKLDLSGDENSGLEGIAFDKKLKKFYILNEKKPGLLLELDNELRIQKQRKLEFASDYSAIDFDDSINVLWILSDEDKTLFKCTTNGDVKASYKLDIEQPEGVALDRKNGKIYIVSDPAGKLYCFEPGKNIL